MTLALLLLIACTPSKSPDDSSSDADADTDADTDTDTDADSDTDTDSDADTYTGATGPWTVSTTTLSVDGTDVTVYVPNSPAESTSLAVVSHGFARGPSNHVGTATRLASWGFVVATPQLPTLSDHVQNGEYVANDLVPALRTAYGAATDGKLALMGHSAGGLASLIAAAETPADALIGLDAVDVSDTGASYAGSVSAPTLLLAGDPSACNSDGNGTAWAALLAGQSWLLSVTDATHCDFESDTDSLCTMVCGANDAARQDRIQAYAVAWAVHQLHGDADAWMQDGAQAAADRAAGTISW